MFKRAASAIQRILRNVDPNPTPAWLEDGAVSLWLYRPDASKLQGHGLLSPMFVLARAWSFAGRSGIAADEPHYWLHGDEGDAFKGDDDVNVMWEIETDERFAANIQGGRLCFIAVLPAQLGHEFPEMSGRFSQSAAVEAAKPVQSAAVEAAKPVDCHP